MSFLKNHIKTSQIFLAKTKVSWYNIVLFNVLVWSMKIFSRYFLNLLLLGSFLFTSGCSFVPQTPVNKKQKFTIMWSIYVGWMPWPYAEQSGILKKWADRYGIEINLKQADYVPSIEAYVAGQADGVVMTNMDALNFAASAGIDSTAIIMGDYSNGNDAVVTRNNLGLCDLKGKKVNLVQYSVSHYLLVRGLEKECAQKITEQDLHLVNTSDSDIAPVFISNIKEPAVVTWNPMLLEILSAVPGTKKVFDSSQIPYEILDMLFLRTDVIRQNPELARALTGAWYETLGIMQSNSQTGVLALQSMADKSGSSLELFMEQLATTNFWYTPAEAAAAMSSKNIAVAMPHVMEFNFKHGLYGSGAKSGSYVGVAFPDASIFGDPNNIKIRFSNQFMEEAAAGKL